MSAACCNPGSYFETEKADGSIVELKTSKGTYEAYSVGKGGKYVIILPDIFGYKWLNVQKFADSISSSAGVRVLVINNHQSGPFLIEPLDFAKFPDWLAANPIQYGIDQLNHLIDAMSHDSSTYHTESIVLLGICYGAKAEASILSNPSYKLIRGGIFNHPSFLDLNDAKSIQDDKSFLFNLAAEDPFFSTSLREEWQKTLEERKVKSVFRVREGVNHGYTTRPQHETDKEEAIKARDAIIEWIKTTMA
jgi:dienelactone hydrolase